MSYLTKTLNLFHKMDNFMLWASHIYASVFIHKKVSKEIKLLNKS